MDRNLEMGVGIVQGIEKAVSNIYNINQAKQKLNMEKETHSADMKIRKAQIDKLELLYGPEQVSAEREKLKAESDMFKARSSLLGIQIQREQQQNEQRAKTGALALGILDKVVKGGKVPPGMRINSQGDFSVSGVKNEDEDLFGSEMPSSSANIEETPPVGSTVTNQSLPEGVTEEDIQHSLELHPEYTRETLLEALSKK
jgi:hypothetical protein